MSLTNRALKALPLITYAAKTYIQKKSFDNKQLFWHIALSLSAFNLNTKSQYVEFNNIVLEIFKFSIVSSVSVLIKDQPPLVKIAVKVATELCTRFAAEYQDNKQPLSPSFFKENVLGVATHHALSEYLPFDLLFGKYADFIRPATRCADYLVNQKLYKGHDIRYTECISKYLGNAAYLNIAAPKLLSEDAVEKFSASALTAVTRVFATNASDAICAHI